MRTKPRVKMIAYPYTTRCPIFCGCEITFYLTPPWREILTLFSCPETIYIAVNRYEFWLAKISSVQLKPMGKPSIVPKYFSIVYRLGPGIKHPFYSKFKNVRSVRDVVAAARFYNFESLLTRDAADIGYIRYPISYEDLSGQIGCQMRIFCKLSEWIG